MIKTYRGLLADGGQDRIRLRTKTGKTGYRIVKFEIVTSAPSSSSEHLCQIWKTETAATAGALLSTIDFTDSDLLGIALWSNDSSAQTNPDDFHVIFDKVIVNQDIYVSNQTINGSNSCNYHIELETTDLSDAQATQATLQALRTIASR